MQAIDAEAVWKASVLAVYVVVLAVGLADLWLFLQGGTEATVSLWLQENPRWFFIPVGLLMLFFVGLALHLYVLPVEWGGVG